MSTRKRNVTPSPFTTAEAYQQAFEEAAAFWSNTSPPIHPSDLKGHHMGTQAAAIYTKTLHRVSTVLDIRTHRLVRRVDSTRTEFTTLSGIAEAFLPLPPLADERATKDAAEREQVFETLRDEFGMFRDFPNISHTIENLQHTPRGFVFSTVRCLRYLAAAGYDPHTLKTIHHANAALAAVAQHAIHWKEQHANLHPTNTLPAASHVNT